MPDAIARDQAALLYSQGKSGVAMSVIASCFLASLPESHSVHRSSSLWLAGMLFLLMARGFDVLFLHPRREARGTSGRDEIRRFAVGVLLTAVMWGLFPLLFFDSMSQLDRTYVATILSGMAGGSATVLAAVQYVVWFYCAGVLLPASGMFILEGGQANASLGILGIVFFCVMAVSSRVTHRATMDAFRLSHELDDANRSLRHEIADHRTTEMLLRESQKLEAVGRLTAGVAHDFNNILMAIGASAEFLLRGPVVGRDPTPRVTSIVRAVERGGRLTQQLLAFARKQALKPEYTSLNDIVTAMDDLIRTSLADTTLVEFNLRHDLWQSYVDRNHVTQVILNLVLNAKDAMPLGGKLLIHTGNVPIKSLERPRGLAAEEYVMLSVSDTGRGMSEEVLDHAFDPFFTTKAVGQGSGLGLSQVHGIVRQSGGLTTIESELGHWTTVRIYLPKASVAEGQRMETHLRPRNSAVSS